MAFWAVSSDFLSENQLQRFAAESPETAYAFRMTKSMRKKARRHKSLLHRAEIIVQNRQNALLLPKEGKLSARPIAKCTGVFKTTLGRIMRNMCAKYLHMPFSRNRTSGCKIFVVVLIWWANCSSRIRRIAVIAYAQNPYELLFLNT